MNFFLLLFLTFNVFYGQNGSLDLTFNNLNTITTSANIGNFALQSDGKVVIVGSFSSINGTTANKVARLNTDGSLDASFNVGAGIAGADRPYKVAIQTDGKIVVIGNFSTFNGVVKNSIVRLNTDGSIDTSFNTGTGFQSYSSSAFAWITGSASILKLRNNGQIVVAGGGFSKYNGTVSNSTLAFCVLNSNGTLDTSFDATAVDGVGTRRIEVLSDDKMIIFTYHTTFFGPLNQHDFYLRKLNLNGSLDTSFTLNNTILGKENIGGVPGAGSGDANLSINDMEQLSSGKILLAGVISSAFGSSNKSLARLNSNGTVDATFSCVGVFFQPTSTLYPGEVYSIQVQSDDKIIAGGTFNLYSGSTIGNIIRFNSNGSYDSSFNPGTGFTGISSTSPNSFTSASQLKLLPNKKVLAIGNFTSYNGVARNSIARLNSDLIANQDFGTAISSIASTVVSNVRANDIHYGATATGSNTVLSFVSTTDPGLTINTTTGAVNAAASVTPGTHTLIYQLCSIPTPSVCTEGTVTITVTSCWKSVAEGSAHTVAIKPNGTLWTWGLNDFGQLGDNTTTNRSTPAQIGSATNWKSVSAGFYFCLAVKTDGTLWAWGLNSSAQLGDGTTVSKLTPVQIGTDTDWDSVSAGGSHSLAIKTNGTLWSWGRNKFGQLGRTGSGLSPLQVGTDTNWQIVSGGQEHSSAKKTNGTLWGWGRNSVGVIGDGTNVNKSVPTQTGTDTDWASIGTGYYHALALKTNGTLWAWGFNNYGELGDGTTVDKFSPTQIGTDTNWAFVSGASQHSIAIKTTGSLWTWGWNQYGQLGDGTNVNKSVPTQIGTGTNWSSASGGSFLEGSTIARKTDGTIWSTGLNSSGQFGNGTTTNSNIFVQTNCQ
ncbi:hypothetical protein [Flavobacterium sp.]|uniref:RCC1 domain-containing protein n=1 Tax=Flavobacterium sp. TaxID=239 RepID=UPI00286C65D6|nr:hypothetical protein [Flavobacterium sp.]